MKRITRVQLRTLLFRAWKLGIDHQAPQEEFERWRNHVAPLEQPPQAKEKTQ